MISEYVFLVTWMLFNRRNVLPKYGGFLLTHPAYTYEHPVYIYGSVFPSSPTFFSFPSVSEKVKVAPVTGPGGPMG